MACCSGPVPALAAPGHRTVALKDRYGVLVPSVDADGNETAGLALPDIAVPTGTGMGWSVRSEFGGDVLPPLGLAATLPNRTNRCIHRTAELTLTSNRSAASCRDAPASTHSTNRVRRSNE
jgi:hypothetical protein